MFGWVNFIIHITTEELEYIAKTPMGKTILKNLFKLSILMYEGTQLTIVPKKYIVGLI